MTSKRAHDEGGEGDVGTGEKRLKPGIHNISLIIHILFTPMLYFFY